MANRNTPFGGKTANTLISADYNAKTRTYYTSAADTTLLFVGDFVRMLGTTTSEGVPYVTAITADSTDILGIVVAIKNVYTKESQLYRDSKDVLEVEVIDDPYAEYDIQVNGTVTTSSVGKIANVYVGAGNILTGMSGMQLDAATIGTGIQIQIIGIVANGDNTLGQYTKVRCITMTHKFLGRLNGTILTVSDVIYVDVKRVGENYTPDGTIFFPYQSIQDAVDYVAEVVRTKMLTISIAPGTYVETVNLNNANLRQLHLRGDVFQSTIIQPSSGNAIECTTNNANFTALTLTGLGFNAPLVMSGAAIFMQSGLRFSGCNIHSSASLAVVNLMRSYDTDWDSTVTITGGSLCYFYNTIFGSSVTIGSGSSVELDDVEVDLALQVIDSASFLRAQHCHFYGAVTVAGEFQSYSNNYEKLLTVGTTAICNSTGDSFMASVAVSGSGQFTINDLNASFTDNITAHAGGGQASATHAYGKIVNILTCATTGDSLMLKPANYGDWTLVRNGGVRDAYVYPQPNEYMDDIADYRDIVVRGQSNLYYAYAIGRWRPMALDVTHEISLGHHIVAHAGGGQVLATLLTAQFNEINQVASAGDSCKLHTGLKNDVVIVRNDGGTQVQRYATYVYPYVGESLNGVVNAYVEVPRGQTMIFYCTADGQWWSTYISDQDHLRTTYPGLAAGTGGAPYIMTEAYNHVYVFTTIAHNTNDFVRLPYASQVGLSFTVILRVEAIAWWFYFSPQSGESVNGVSGAPWQVSMSPGRYEFLCDAIGNWILTGGYLPTP
jgi:hypothetical protein